MGTMSMLNQAAVEALCSAAYMENYLECMENLPDDLQRSVSLLRELDSQTCDYLREISLHQELYLGDHDSVARKRSLVQIQRALVKCQEVGDEKLQIVAHIVEFVENRTRQLEQDLENLDPSTAPSHLKRDEDVIMVRHSMNPNKKIASHAIASGASSPAHTATMPSPSTDQDKPLGRKRPIRVIKKEEKKEEKEKLKKPRKKKAKKNEKISPIDISLIDPDEPTYCSCRQISYGEMIGCDNDDCPIEWYHFNCVGLTTKPKGKWYCPECRGDKPTVPRQQQK